MFVDDAEFEEYRRRTAFTRAKVKAKVWPIHSKSPTAKELAATDGNFKKACEMAGVEPSIRQSRRFRNKQGSAFNRIKKSSYGKNL